MPTGNAPVVEANLAGRLAMPPALAEQGFSLRPETETDLPFLRCLYISTRWEEIAPVVDWTHAQKIAFLESQFAAQRRHYLIHYANAAFDILEAQGSPAGRFYVDRRADTFLIVDLALLPEWRGRGIGTALIEALFAEARRADKGVGISVEKFNPAQRLYRRLGFREYAEDGIYWFMHWQAEPDESARIS
jgi:ribosomal protein S18 acetylase RimI-like enzyme